MQNKTIVNLDNNLILGADNVEKNYIIVNNMECLHTINNKRYGDVYGTIL